jgi:hypothetical protein
MGRDGISPCAGYCNTCAVHRGAYAPRVASSKLARDPHGRLIAVITSCDSVAVPPGHVYLVLGTAVEVSVGTPGRFFMLGERTGRRPSRVTPSRRLPEPPVETRCEQCGQRFTRSARRARSGAPPRCELCRGLPEPPTPTAEMFEYWTSRFSREQLAELAAPLIS